MRERKRRGATGRRLLFLRGSSLRHLFVGVAGNHFVHGFGLRAEEVGGEVAGEEGIIFAPALAFCACECAARGMGPLESDEGRGKFDLRIVWAKLDGPFDQRVAVDIVSGILANLLSHWFFL